MRPDRRLRSVTLLAALVGMAAPCWATTVQDVDGIAAVVDDEVISIGQVRRTAALLQEDSVQGVFPQCSPIAATEVDAQLRAALECLIDTTLVFREVRRFPQLQTTDAEIDAALQQVRAATGGAGLDAELRRWQFSETELRDVIRRQLLVSAYVDSRFREIVQVSDEDVLRAWTDEIVPDMLARGIEVPPLGEVDDEFVRPLLQEREVNRLVQSWISDLRERATIQRRFP